jgi:DNA end-binding protein Ku
MARSLWRGSLSFGLVNVPVALYSGVRDVDLHFHQLHGKDKARIEVRRFCSKEDEEVPWEEIGHAYELDEGGQVVLTDEELDRVSPRKTRTIDIEAFVDAGEVDPIHFDHPYLLAPTGDVEGPLRAYRLLVEVMRESGQLALGRFVLRSKEHLVAVGVRGDLLALTTMRFADEVRPRKGIAPGGRKPAKQQIDGAVALLEELTVEWDPTRYTDCYRERLEAVVKRKRRGATIEVPEDRDEPEPSEDIMATLKAALEQAREQQPA